MAQSKGDRKPGASLALPLRPVYGSLVPMTRALLVLSAVALLVVVAAVAFWPDRPEPEPVVPLAGQQEGEACTSCTLRHQRLSEPTE